MDHYKITFILLLLTEDCFARIKVSMILSCEANILKLRFSSRDRSMLDNGNLRGPPPQCQPLQEIAGRIKGLLTIIVP